MNCDYSQVFQALYKVTRSRDKIKTDNDYIQHTSATDKLTFSMLELLLLKGEHCDRKELQ